MKARRSFAGETLNLWVDSHDCVLLEGFTLLLCMRFGSEPDLALSDAIQPQVWTPSKVGARAISLQSEHPKSKSSGIMDLQQPVHLLRIRYIGLSGKRTFRWKTKTAFGRRRLFPLPAAKESLQCTFCLLYVYGIVSFEKIIFVPASPAPAVRSSVPLVD